MQVPSPRVATGALAALLVWGFFAATTVRASCGDYVVVEGETQPHFMPESGSQQPVEHSQRPASPCPGASCSPSGDMPLAGAVAPNSGDPDQWAWIHSSREAAQRYGRVLLILDSLSSPQDLATRIFHPPRS